MHVCVQDVCVHMCECVRKGVMSHNTTCHHALSTHTESNKYRPFARLLEALLKGDPVTLHKSH